MVGDRIRISRPLLHAIHSAIAANEDHVTVEECFSSRPEHPEVIEPADVRLVIRREM